MGVGLLDEAYDLAAHCCQAAGPNVMYFETGQGSALSADARKAIQEGWLESRVKGPGGAAGGPEGAGAEVFPPIAEKKLAIPAG